MIPRLFLAPLAALTVLAASCTAAQNVLSLPPGATPVPSATPKPVGAPTARAAAEQFLALWKDKKYREMYRLLSASARERISEEKFVGRYEAIADEATIQSIAYTIGAGDGASGSIPFTIEYQTALFDRVTSQNVLPVAKENGWLVDWAPTVIFPDLTGDNLVRYLPKYPRRGSIFDHAGRPLAVEVFAMEVGIVPGQIQDKEGLIAVLANALQMPPDAVRAKVDAPAQPDWYVPIKRLPYNAPVSLRAQLESVPGVVIHEVSVRSYPQGAVAAQVIGYETEVQADDLKDRAAEGYQEGDWIGRAGLEGSFEAILRGQKGGTLNIIRRDGAVVRQLASKPPEDGADLILTIDAELQKRAEAALNGARGSVVVLDPRTGALLALASSPGFDPNVFINGLTDAQWQQLNREPETPMLLRPTLGQYPPGSIFKTITLAAGVERGGYKPTDRLPCPAVWYGLGPNLPKKNWITADHGSITLIQAIIESCNPVFYEIGKKLDLIDSNILPDFARAAGLGKPTGLEGLPEAKGLIPDAKWKREVLHDGWATGDAVNLAIGQGFALATPLQMGHYYGAVANGGTLYQPYLVQEVRQGGQVVKTAQPVAQGKLPYSPGTLAAIQEGMKGVANAPSGTAVGVFSGSGLSVAGKSGTAEDQGLSTHAWFVAYSPVEQPRVVVVVQLEEGGMGSANAAPVLLQVLKSYYALQIP